MVAYEAQNQFNQLQCYDEAGGEICSQCACCYVNTGEGTMCGQCRHEFDVECEHDYAEGMFL